MKPSEDNGIEEEERRKGERAAEVLERLKGAYPNARYYLNFRTPLELLVATILSAQARDERVNAVTEKLFPKYKTAQDYANVPQEQLEQEIRQINFYRHKAKALRSACQTLVERYHGRVPDTMEELLKLPGIGRKTANAILTNAFGKVEGIVVDTHVIRVSRRLGFTREKDPDRIERDLMALLPKEDWQRVPWLMKEHGRAVCTPKHPKCGECVLHDLCPQVGV